MSEIWTFFHKTTGAVKCNGCAYEIPNTRDNPVYADALWTHLSSAHRDVYERSHHFETNASATFKKAPVSPTNLPSEIWNYFTKISTGRVQCNLCSHLMSHGYRKSTHGLWGHIKSAHMDEFKQTLFFKSRSLSDNVLAPHMRESGNGERQRAVRTNRCVTATSEPAADVWTFFSKLSDDRVRCIICWREIFRAFSTDRLWAHLQARHDSVFRATGHFASLSAENVFRLAPGGPRPELHDHTYAAPLPVKRCRAMDDVGVSVDVIEEGMVQTHSHTVDDDIIWI